MQKLIYYSRFVLVILSVCVLGCADDLLPVNEEDNTVTVSLPDYNYVIRQFFFLETPGDDWSNPQFGFGQFYPVIGGAGADSLEVFMELLPGTEWTTNTYPKYFVQARPDSDNNGTLDGNMYSQWFCLLTEGIHYDLIQDYGSSAEPKYIGIRLIQQLPLNKALAVRYKLDLGTEQVSVGDYGYFPAGDPGAEPPTEPEDLAAFTIQAELICPDEDDFLPSDNPYALYGSTWNMMLRNVYSLEGYGLEQYESIGWEIRSLLSSSSNPAIHEYSGEKYLRIFGLDRWSENSCWGSDGILDENLITLFPGYLMFPFMTPFNISKNELMVVFSEGPPDFEISDSLIVFVDSLSTNLERNHSIYDEPYGDVPSHCYDIVVEIPIDQ